MAKKPQTANFEDALQELDTLVKRLDDGELPLAESLAAFERGVNLTKVCQQLLDEAELKIQTLSDTKDGNDSEDA